MPVSVWRIWIGLTIEWPTSSTSEFGPRCLSIVSDFDGKTWAMLRCSLPTFPPETDKNFFSHHLNACRTKDGNFVKKKGEEE